MAAPLRWVRLAALLVWLAVKVTHLTALHVHTSQQRLLFCCVNDRPCILTRCLNMSTPACFARLQIMEQKGLDIVRRDWCPLSKDVGNHALKAILSGAPREDVVNSIHEHLEDVKEKVLLVCWLG